MIEFFQKNGFKFLVFFLSILFLVAGVLALRNKEQNKLNASIEANLSQQGTNRSDKSVKNITQDKDTTYTSPTNKTKTS